MRRSCRCDSFTAMALGCLVGSELLLCPGGGGGVGEDPVSEADGCLNVLQPRGIAGLKPGALLQPLGVPGTCPSREGVAWDLSRPCVPGHRDPPNPA